MSTIPLTIRPATAIDIPFLVECIRLAESSGTDVLSYRGLFNLNEEQLQVLLYQLVGEDFEGLELCYPNFWLAETHGQPVAGCAAWIEDAQMPSRMLKAQLLAHFLGAQLWLQAGPRLKKIAEIDLPRQPGTLQLDSIAVLPNWQGQGLAQVLLQAVILRMKKEHAALTKAQIILMQNNLAARRAYEKLGFVLTLSNQTQSPEIFQYYPGNGRLLMEKAL